MTAMKLTSETLLSAWEAAVSSDSRVLSFRSQGYSVFPGFCDVHVHFREPGFSYKETIKSGSTAASHGGYTAVCTMPNLSPVPDSVEALHAETTLIRDNAVISVYPYGTITVGQNGKELSDMEGMAKNVIAFSDDGRGVQEEDMMRAAMQKAKMLGKMIVAHCEVNALLHGGYIHDGEYARAHGHRGISSESEYAQVARDLRLAKETGCPYHVCHISAKETVELIRAAKADGVDVTCETAPHYLVMDDSDLKEDGRYKMNPPLRSKEDREALLRGLLDGTIDMIATDHAPHSREEKSRGLEKSLFGIVGLETAFPVLYTKLVLPGILPLERLIDALALRPRIRFGIPLAKDYTVFDLNKKITVTEDFLLSMGKATPFLNESFFGECKATVSKGETVYQK